MSEPVNFYRPLNFNLRESQILHLGMGRRIPFDLVAPVGAEIEDVVHPDFWKFVRGAQPRDIIFISAENGRWELELRVVDVNPRDGTVREVKIVRKMHFDELVDRVELDSDHHVAREPGKGYRIHATDGRPVIGKYYPTLEAAMAGFRSDSRNTASGRDLTHSKVNSATVGHRTGNAA
jgi:hypothetical protein